LATETFVTTTALESANLEVIKSNALRLALPTVRRDFWATRLIEDANIIFAPAFVEVN
jgi:hypothetical protein